MIRLVSLVESTVGKACLLAEHGLAMWIEARGGRVLFDTGQGLALHRNARELGIDPHGHSDHTGALASAASCAAKPGIYAHPDAFRRRFVREPEGRCPLLRRIRHAGLRESLGRQDGRRVRLGPGPLLGVR